MKTIYLVRHGDIGLGPEKRCLGLQDLPLSSEGRKQALILQERLREVAIDRIYCSSLTRSFETAAIIASARGIRPMAIAGLHELDVGEWDGMLFDDIRNRFPEEYRQRGDDIANYRPPRGESFADCSQRVIPVFEGIVQGEGESILVVGHAGVNRVILCHAQGLPIADVFHFEQPYGCLYRLIRDENGFRSVRLI